MGPVRATLEADLVVAPLLSHSVTETLDIIETDRRLPRLPMFRINLYQAETLTLWPGSSLGSCVEACSKLTAKGHDLPVRKRNWHGSFTPIAVELDAGRERQGSATSRHDVRHVSKIKVQFAPFSEVPWWCTGQ